MLSFKRWAIFVLIISVIYLDVSKIYVPDDFERPIVYKMKSLFMSVAGYIARLGSYFNLGYEPVIFRNFLNAATTLSNSLKRRDGLVIVENTVFIDINVRIYTPYQFKTSNELHPFMIYYHGGGYSIGNLDGYDTYLYELAKKANIVIISVDYNLSPENAFPGPVNDCIKVTEYILKNHEKMNLDIKRYTVAGDSAGGHAAAYISQHLAQNNYQIPKLQVLIYPWVQMYIFFLPSDIYYRKKTFLSNSKFPLGHFMWWLMGVKDEISEEMDDVFKNNSHFLLLDEETRIKYDNYLDINFIPKKYKTGKSYYNDYLIKKSNIKELPEDHILIRNKELANKFKNVLSPKASPSLADAEILRLLPKAYFIIFEWDTLKDQGLIYAERLKSNGVPVEVAFYENAFHGMVPFIEEDTGYKMSRTIFDNLVKYIVDNI